MIKKLLLTITLTFTAVLFAQIPQGFNYQAIVRNQAGNVLINQSVTFKLGISTGTLSSIPVYIEQHTVTTDDLGGVNFIIGQGLPQSGVFNSINWSQGAYLSIEVNTGSGFVALGTTQLMSVPYALYAVNSGSSYLPIATHANVYTFDTDQHTGVSLINLSGFIMPSHETLSYIESGFIVGTSPNITFDTSSYQYKYIPFHYAISAGIPPVYLEDGGHSYTNTNVYIKTYAKNSQGEYLYGNEVVVFIP